MSVFPAGIEGGFDVEQEQYEEEVKVVLFPDRQEVTLDDLSSMPDVVRERVGIYYYSELGNEHKDSVLIICLLKYNSLLIDII